MQNKRLIMLGIGLVAIFAAADSAAQRQPVMRPEGFPLALRGERIAGLYPGSPEAERVASAAATAAKTIWVDCTKGQSISKALTDTSVPLLIEIRGMCSEQIVVERSGVTLHGSDPDFDGIQAPASPAVTVRNASLWPSPVRLENLTLSGGGLQSQSTLLVQVVNCRITGDPVVGVSVLYGTADLTDVVVTGNNRGVVATGSAWVNCWSGCVIKDNAPGAAVRAQVHSLIQILDSEVSGGVALQTGSSSKIYVDSSTVTGVVQAYNGGTIQLFFGTTLTGAIYAADYSNLTLSDVTQIIPSGRNNLDEGSRLTALNSALAGPTRLSSFSTLSLLGTTSHDGDIECNSAADAFAKDPNLVSGSVTGCMHLVKP